jgi:site-specific DNA recombinase
MGSANMEEALDGAAGGEQGIVTRAAILVRVSDVRQADSDRMSLPAQLRVARDRCSREGWEVVAEYRAEGESAFTSEISHRRSIRDLLAGAEAGEFDILVVHELSRFARDEQLGHQVINRLERAGVRLVNATSEIDYTTPEGRMMFGLDLGLSAYWSRKMAVHIRKGKDERFMLGLPTGSIPFGYVAGESTRDAPVIVQLEADAIRWAFEARTRGASLSAIQDEWQARGLRPRSRTGYTSFTISSIQSLMENPFYAGWVTHRGQRRRGAHEAVIGEDLFAKAQGIARPQRQGVHGTALFVGLATCAVCGGPIWVTRTGSKGYRADSYREPSHMQFRDCANARSMCRASGLDDQVIAAVRAIGQDRTWLRDAEREARKVTPVSPVLRRELVAQRQRATSAYIAGALPESEWKAMVADLDRRLADMPETPAIALRATEHLASFAQAWDVATIEERRQLCRILFARVPIDTKEKRIWVEPREEYAALFDLRRRHVLELPPAGIEPAHMV